MVLDCKNYTLINIHEPLEQLYAFLKKGELMYTLSISLIEN